MLTAYLEAAMRHAAYEDLGAEGWYADIPGFNGLWANADSPEVVRRELRSVLEGWALLGLRLGDRLPVADGLDMTPAVALAS